MLRSLLIAILILLAVGKPTQKKSAVSNVVNVTLEKGQSQQYHLNNLNSAKAIMITLEQSSDLKFSPFQLNISSSSKSTLCSFKYANNLCVLQHSSNEINATIFCLDVECKFSIVVSQRIVVSVNDDLDFKKKLADPGEIFRINKRRFNTILEIYSERDEHKVLSDEITVFCNIHAFPLRQVEELDANSAVFGLKPIAKDTDQYVFIENRSNRSEHFKASFRSHKGEVRDGISIVDFIENYGKHSKNNYNFVGEIKNNFQINLRLFAPKESKDIPLTLIIKGLQIDGINKNEIGKLQLKQIDFQNNKFFDFTFAISKSTLRKNIFIYFQIMLGEVEDKSIFFELEARDVSLFEISIFDHIYFACGPKESIKFTVVPLVKFQLADGDKDIKLVTNGSEQFFNETQVCSLQRGCNLDIKSELGCSNCSFRFDLRDEDIINHIIYYDVMDDTIEGKVDLQEEIYFKYAMNGKGTTQVIVNSINVVIYAAFDNYKRCKIPTASCHQYAINQQNPLIITNADDQPAQLIVGVVGLQKTPFKVRFINEINGLSVKLGEKFSYLMSDKQREIELRLQLPNDYKDQVHFNLVSPIHSSKLTVINGNKGEKVSQSLDGYISFRNRDIVSDLFIIKIEKINLYYDEYLHFTLYTTSATTFARLDSTTPHYEKYAPHAEKKFLVEYQPSESTAINIYTQNLQKTKAHMTLEIRQINPRDKGAINKPLLTKKLIRDYQFIVLQDFEICEDINCELELSIQNTANSALQQTLSLISSESIISLDDSIWSVYEINELTRRIHFYFIPRHEGKPIKILFNTDDNHLYINYRIFNSKHSINPQDWPFDHIATESIGHIPNHQEIHIEGNDTELQSCWPNCVIIINVNEGSQIGENPLIEFSVIKSFKILATNSIVELLEDTKIEFTLRSEEERDFFIVLSRNFEILTFYTYYSVGRAKITPYVVYKGQDYPLEWSSFKDFQTRLQKRYIYPEIERKGINIEKVLLKISIKAETNLKMTLEYTSSMKDVQQLKMDQLIPCNLQPGQQTIYQFIPERDFTLKFYRHQGFPIFKIFKCIQKNYLDCLNKNKKLFDNQVREYRTIQEKVKSNLGKEIAINDAGPTDFQIFIQKSFVFSGEACAECVYFVWMYCYEGNLILTLNLRTAYSEVELKQGHNLLQKAEYGKHNRYLINMVHNQVARIGIFTISGVIQVVITQGKKTLFNETLVQSQQYKEYEIDGQDENDFLEDSDHEKEIEKKEKGGWIRRSDENHVFKHGHITVSAIGWQPAEFTIIYSIGQTSNIYLEDGIVIKRNVVSEHPTSFFYRNNNQKEHAYLTISAQRSFQSAHETGNVISVRFYYYPNAGDRKVKEVFNPEMPPKRNENYIGSAFTAVYELPAQYELYEVEILGNPYAMVTVSMNHQELVYLPLGFQYLIKLHPQQSLNVVIDTPKDDYLEMKVQKCGLSSPRLQYTNDANEFKQGIFEAESKITNNNFKQYIKSKLNSATMHFKFIAPSDSDALFTISADGRSSKFINEEDDKYKPGDDGIVGYKMTQTDTVEIMFKPVLCEKKECTQTINYFLVIAESMSRVQEELNCAGAYFVPQAQLPTTDVIEISKKHLDVKRNEFKYHIKLNKNQEFIGVKGVVSESKEEIQYVPIQIHDTWGELQNVSLGFIVMVSLVLALVLTVVIVVSTKLARRGYRPVSSDE